MTVRQALFDTGAPGRPVEAEGPVAPHAGTVRYASGLHGPAAALVPGTDLGTLRLDVSATSWWVARWYARIAAGAPTGHTFLAWVHTTEDGYLADFQLRNTGGGTFYNRFNYATTPSSIAAGPAPRDEWLRVEYEWRQGAFVEVRLWRAVADPAEDVGAADVVLRRDGIQDLGAAGVLYLGTNRAAGHDVVLDSVAVSDTSTSPGPYVASTTTPMPASGVPVAGVVVGGQVRPARATGVVVGGQLRPITALRKPA